MVNIYLKQGMIVFLLFIWSLSCQEAIDNADASYRAPADDQDQRTGGTTAPASSASSCEQSVQCLRMCERATRNTLQQSACERQTPSIVEGFYNTLAIWFKTPVKFSYLNSIQPEDIKNVMKINSFSLVENIEDFDRTDAMQALQWIAVNPSIARAFYQDSSDKRDADEILEELLKNIDQELRNALRIPLESGQSFFLEAHESNNQNAIRWGARLFKRECVREAGSRYNSVGESYRDTICMLGELYCHRKGKTFEDAFMSLVDADYRLMNYIQAKKPKGLGKSEDNLGNLGQVCKSFCKIHKQTPFC